MENILLRALFAYSNNILKKIIILQILFQYVDNIHVKIKFVDNKFSIFNKYLLKNNSFGNIFHMLK